MLVSTLSNRSDAYKYFTISVVGVKSVIPNFPNRLSYAKLFMINVNKNLVSIL